jgi:hypothetical protein
MPNFKPNPDGMKPSGFKMKGWSGYQKPSPARKDWKDVVQDFKAVKEDLESKIKDIGSGKMGKKIKSDLQGLQKEISKKLGKKEEVTDIEPVEIEPVEVSVVDPGDLVETNPWTSGSGDDPWEYKKIDGGYQTRKGPNGDIINVTDPKSKAYQAIGEKIFSEDNVDPSVSAGKPPVTIVSDEDRASAKLPTEQPKRKKSSPYTPGYIKGYKGYGG